MRKYYKHFLLCSITILFSIACFAQNSKDSISIRKNIDIAFTNFQKKDSLFLDGEFQQELKEIYIKEILSLKPEYFGNKSKAEGLINYYSNSIGIEEILREFIEDTEQNWDEIFSIGGVLYMKIYFNSDNPGAMMKPNLPNKYATLLIQIEPKKINATIYLNGKLICLVSQAKNGIRVHSNEKYKIEITTDNKIACTKEVILDKQEKKVEKCVINK